ncbi:Pex12 amino terminal region-domain-containing protein [Leucosporidium creatinivorum]|uniref:RING-type E3 ubiquitin transferase (cysteine targeting) n=1 Tax=Leucosporidium creatinivorum TaxID=106004 RepID=A0A1Y2G0U2_9BASI|nr:Pex12 amino terminal region-domain-containing protein [Leucosporidium creatinivorum]
MATSAPPNLERFWHPPPASLATELPAIRSSLAQFPSPQLSVSRVAQLDADLLDHELEGILGAPVWKAMEGIRAPGRRSWEPEMMAMLRIAVLKMSLYDRGATYGAGLQNLKYRNEWKHQEGGLQSTAIDSSLLPIQKAAYMTLLVLPSYLYSRIRDRMLSSSWSDEDLPRSWLFLLDLRRGLVKRRREEDDGQWGREWKRVAWEVLSLGEKLGAIAALVNFLVFLYDGRYRTLVDRVLGMRLIYAQRSITPNVSFEFLNRQLVWEAFTEFLLFLMPLINVHRLRLRLSRLLSTKSAKSRSLALILSALPAPLARTLRVTPRQQLAAPSSAESEGEKDSTKPAERPKGPLHFLPDSTCPICYSQSTAPPTSLPTDPTTSADSGLSSSLAASAAAGEQDTSVKLPYTTDCGWECRYCYYCVVGRLAAAQEEGEESWGCLRCGGEVRGVKREVEKVVESGDEGLLVAPVEGGEEADESGSEGGADEEQQEETGSIGSEHDRWRA